MISLPNQKLGRDGEASIAIDAHDLALPPDAQKVGALGADCRESFQLRLGGFCGLIMMKERT
jgi:hypothetical protein